MTATVLVTGANGFLGRELISQLQELDLHIRAFVLPNEPVPDNWEGTIQVIRGDVTDAPVVLAAAENCVCIYHLAAVVGDSGSDELHQKVSVGGTENACAAAIAHNAKLVLASSIVVYGNRIGRETCNEHTPHGKAQGPYSRAKQGQEQVVIRYAEEQQLDYAFVRPGNIYGPGSGPWLHDLSIELRKGMPTLVNGGGFDGGLVYVSNVAGMLIQAAANTSNEKHFLAVDGFNISWKRYMHDLAKLLGAPRPRSVPYLLLKLGAYLAEFLWKILSLKGRPPVTAEAFNLIAHANLFDNQLSQSTLKWKPKISYQHGLAATEKYIHEKL